MKQMLKRFLYAAIVRGYWRLTGRRVVRAFGHELALHPDTDLPMARKFPLPRGTSQSTVVLHTDLVQLHAICRALESMSTPPTVVEVGAYQGFYATLLGKFIQRLGGRLITIEPNPGNYAILADNIRRNGLTDTVIAEQCAIAPTAGVYSLSVDPTEPSQATLATAPSTGRAQVRAEPLARVLERHSIRHVDVLIVDVEGYELPVLRSFPWESVGVGQIFCEFHPYNWASAGYAASDMELFFREHGLACLDMYFREYPPFPASPQYIGPCLLFPAKS